MNAKQRNQWNKRFADAWREMQQRDNRAGRKALILNTQLVIAARKFRDDGQEAVPTAAGLYMGTRDAQARMS
jgi:hypothetical protein